MESGQLELDELAERIHDVCQEKGWDKGWSKGGCYIHLEVSEFIESLRGKGDSSPTEEAADVLCSLFSVMMNYGIKPSNAIKQLKILVEELEQ